MERGEQSCRVVNVAGAAVDRSLYRGVGGP